MVVLWLEVYCDEESDGGCSNWVNKSKLVTLKLRRYWCCTRKRRCRHMQQALQALACTRCGRSIAELLQGEEDDLLRGGLLYRLL